MFEIQTKDESFEQSHWSEKSKSGTVWDFLTSILLQNIKKFKVGPFEDIQIFRKNSVVDC